MMKYIPENRRFVVLHDDDTGDSLLTDIDSGEPYICRFTYGSLKPLHEWAEDTELEITGKHERILRKLWRNPRGAAWDTAPDWLDRKPAAAPDGRVWKLGFTGTDDHVYGMIRLLADKPEIVYMERPEPWSLSKRLGFVRTLVCGLCVEPVVFRYSMSPEGKCAVTVYRGAEVIRTIADLEAGRLLLSEDMFSPDGSDRPVPYTELPKHMIRRLHSAKLSLHMLRSGAPSESGMDDTEIAEFFNTLK